MQKRKPKSRAHSLNWPAGRCRSRMAVRCSHKAWVDMAQQNARLAILARNQATAHQEQRLAALQEALQLPEAIARIECFDISHTQGEATVASCVVYQDNGMKKADYRRFQYSRYSTRRRLCRNATSGYSPLWQYRSRGGQSARPDSYRWRQRPSQLRLRSLGRSRPSASAYARCRQRRGAQARPGNADFFRKGGSRYNCRRSIRRCT